MANIKLKNIYKTYGDKRYILDNLSLSVDSGEHVAILGACGSGKSSLLKVIAGLEDSSRGSVFADEKPLDNVGLVSRNIAMIFGDFLLYPNKTVLENLAYGLELRKVAKEQVKLKVDAVIRQLNLQDLANKKAKELSKIDALRVALGRVVVRECSVLLLDEPFTGLNKGESLHACKYVLDAFKVVNTPFISIMTDITTAKSVANRVAMLQNGKISQIEAPSFIVDYPRNLFIATYIGGDNYTVFKSYLKETDGKVCVKIGGVCVALGESITKNIVDEYYYGRGVFACIDSNHILMEKMDENHQAEPCVIGKVESIEKSDNGSVYFVKVDGKEEFVLLERQDGICAEGDGVKLTFDSSKMQIFDAETECNIAGCVDYNRILSTISYNDGKPSLDICKNVVKLPSNFVNRLVPLSGENVSVVLEVLPQNLYEKSLYGSLHANDKSGGDNIVLLSAEVNHMLECEHYNLVYATLVDGGKIVAKTSKDKVFKPGDSVDVVLDLSAVEVRNAENYSKMLAGFDVMSNIVPVKIAQKGAKTRFKAGKCSFEYDGAEFDFDSLKSNLQADISVRFSPYGFRLASGKAKNKCKICGVVVDTCSLGSRTLINFKLSGSELVLSAILGGNLQFMHTDKIFLEVNEKGIKEYK